MQIKCEVCKGVSTKTGKPYYYLYIEELEKRIMLEKIELKCLVLLHKEIQSLEVKK